MNTIDDSGDDTGLLPVGEVARLSGTTPRTLHHYEEVGLLAPAERTEAGYRLYGEAELERLQRILSYRALGLPLSEIRRLLEDGGGSSIGHLERQRNLLETQITRLRSIVDAIDYEMEARKMGINLTPEERLQVFGDFDPVEHAAEAEQRWGETGAWKESQRRTAGYDKQDWERIRDEVNSIEADMVAAKRAGVRTDTPEARALTERHRAHIERWFYPCSPAMYASLTEMYVTDDRFRGHYEALEPGLADWIRSAATA